MCRALRRRFPGRVRRQPSRCHISGLRSSQRGAPTACGLASGCGLPAHGQPGSRWVLRVRGHAHVFRYLINAGKEGEGHRCRGSDHSTETRCSIVHDAGTPAHGVEALQQLFGCEREPSGNFASIADRWSHAQTTSVPLRVSCQAPYCGVLAHDAYAPGAQVQTAACCAGI